jgi:hypothetical protein
MYSIKYLRNVFRDADAKKHWLLLHPRDATMQHSMRIRLHIHAVDGDTSEFKLHLKNINLVKIIRDKLNVCPTRPDSA